MNLKSPSVSLATAWLINSLAYSIVYPFIPIYLHVGRGIPMTEVGLIFPLMGIAAIFGPPVAGWLTDRAGQRFVLQFGQTARAWIFVCLALMAYFEASFWLFAAVLTLNTGVGSFFGVAADSYLADITTEKERPLFYGHIRIGTNIGWTVGPMLGAFLARAPFWLMFLVTAVLCLGGAWYTAKVCRPPEKGGNTLRIRQQITRKLFLQLFSERQMAFLLSGVFLLYLLVSQLYSTLSIYATSTVGVNRNTLGLVYSINGLTIILLQLPLTRLADKLRQGQNPRLLTGCLLYAAGYFSLAFSDGGISLGLAVFALTLGEVYTQPAIYTMLAKLAPPGLTGSTMAMLGLIRGVGYAIGPWLGALAYARWTDSPVLLWGSLASFAVAAAGVFILMDRRANCPDPGTLESNPPGSRKTLEKLHSILKD